MSVVVETTLGDITIDLFIKERPRASLNFLKLCKMKYYNFNLFHTISRGFIAQTGDPTGSRNGGESIYGVIEGPLKRYFQSEKMPRIKHTVPGLISFVGNEDSMIGSQFFITLGSELTYLDEQHCVFGEVTEGMDVLEILNETICDQDNRPYQDVRITHTVILDDPFPDPIGLVLPERSPSPSAERLQGGRIAPDEEIDETEGKSLQEVNEILADKLAKAGATILEMIGDIPDADMKPPENVLFVCKLNPVTTDEDLNIIFSRFGKINSCEVIRDRKTGESLQYAFVEFDEQKSCEDAYFKMDNVLIDDRRIHVDFSQSVAKVKWHGKGRGVTVYDDKGRKSNDKRNDLGNGRYNKRNEYKQDEYKRDEYKNKKSSSDKRDEYKNQESIRYQEGRKNRSRSRSYQHERRYRYNQRSSDSSRSQKSRVRVERSRSRSRLRSRSRSKERSRDYKSLNRRGYDDFKNNRRRYEEVDERRVSKKYKNDDYKRDKRKIDEKLKRRKSSSDDSKDESSSSESDSSTSSESSSEEERHKKSSKKSKKDKKSFKKEKKKKKEKGKR